MTISRRTRQTVALGICLTFGFSCAMFSIGSIASGFVPVGIVAGLAAIAFLYSSVNVGRKHQ